MAFKLESEMLAPVEQWLKKQGLQTKAEYANPWGVCDIVGCSFYKTRVRERLSLGQKKPIGPKSRVHLLTEIPPIETGRAVTLRKLIAVFDDIYDNSEINVELEKLEAGKFIARNKHGNIQKINGWMPLHKRIVAVELKLERTQDALAQARNNLQMTSESYVAMPSQKARKINRSKFRKQFQLDGIGLISVEVDGCKRLILPCGENKHLDEVTQAHCCERFWAAATISS